MSLPNSSYLYLSSIGIFYFHELWKKELIQFHLFLDGMQMCCRCFMILSNWFLQSSQGILKKGAGNPWEKNWVSILDSIAIPSHVPTVFCKNTWPLWRFLTFFDVNILPIIYGGFSLDHCMAGHVESHLIISRENGFKEYKRYNQGGEGQDWCFPDSCCWKWPLKSTNCYIFDDKIRLSRSLSSKFIHFIVLFLNS